MELMNCTGGDNRLLAVRLQNASFEYKELTFEGPRRVPVLDGLNMEVPVGTIYGLLGASGCGKTTILQNILGQRKLSKGSVRVFGVEPGSPGSGVPGQAVGYMPQELALPEDFTISETMTFFGWLVGMSYTDTKARLSDLCRLLDLPSSNTVVRNLSGGQQRRVSFAVALLHKPPLLILDEPTVGLDPLLRQGIWEHLVQRTSDGKTTVVITTHYIEEARGAHRVGMLRGGRLMDEAAPSSLISKYGCVTLEDVLLKLCLRQQAGELPKAERQQAIVISSQQDEPQHPILVTEQSRQWKLRALLWKDLLRLRRNKAAAVMFLLLGAIQSSLFCLGVGLDPKGLRLVVHNEDADCGSYSSSWQWQNTSACGNYTALSCSLIETLRHDPHIKVIDSKDPNLVNRSIVEGPVWGSIHFGPSFSSGLQKRILLGDRATESVSILGSVEAQLDMSSFHEAHLLKALLTQATFNFTQKIMMSCGWSALATEVPIRFNEPIYGTRWPVFRDFAAPGMILGTAYCLSCVGALSAILPEKRDGLIARSLVAGISYADILLSQMAVQLLLSGLQTLIMLEVMWGIFDVPRLGSIVAEGILCFITAAGGMWLGFFIGISIDDELTATEMAIFSFFSFTFLSGMFWPIEAMFEPLRWMAVTLPLTLPSAALSNMMERGWSVFAPTVLAGFSVAIGWIALTVILTAGAIKLRNI